MEKTWIVHSSAVLQPGATFRHQVEVSAETSEGAQDLGARLLASEGVTGTMHVQLHPRALSCGHPEGCRIDHPIHEGSSTCGWCWVNDCLESVQEEWDNAERRIGRLKTEINLLKTDLGLAQEKVFLLTAERDSLVAT